MKKINPNNITHIILKTGLKGIENYLGNIIQVSYLPEKKNPWWKRNYPEGYYQEGKYFNPTSYYDGLSYYRTSVVRRKGYAVVGGQVYTNSYIEIFCGKDLIHKEVFQTQDDMEAHVKRNYPKCNVTYN